MKIKLNMSLILFVIIVISLFFLSGCPRIDVIKHFLYEGEDPAESTGISQEGKTSVRKMDINVRLPYV